MGTAFVLQVAATMGREVGGLVAAGEEVAGELKALAVEANNPESDLVPDARVRIWRVCVCVHEKSLGRVVAPRDRQKENDIPLGSPCVWCRQGMEQSER